MFPNFWPIESKIKKSGVYNKILWLIIITVVIIIVLTERIARPHVDYCWLVLSGDSASWACGCIDSSCDETGTQSLDRYS